jgi:hypothetical protein
MHTAWERIGGMKLYLHAFLSLTLDGVMGNIRPQNIYDSGSVSADPIPSTSYIETLWITYVQKKFVPNV